MGGSWKDELASVEFRQAVISEWIATFMFLFATIGCVVFTQDGGITTARQLEVALVFGAMITILVYIFGGISGGNINPAVSWALMIMKKISPLRCAAYTAAQCMGAVCGAGMVRIMTPALFDKVDGGANEIQKGATAQESVGVEFGCTFILVMTVMAATDPVRKDFATITPLVVGLAVTAAHFVAIPVDNCSINPARSFGVSAISGNWNGACAPQCTRALHHPPHPPPLRADHSVFWFGPYLGATAAALVYQYLLSAEGKPAGAKALVDEDAAPVKAVAGRAPEAVSVAGDAAVESSEWK
jgi:aquaporin PIP